MNLHDSHGDETRDVSVQTGDIYFWEITSVGVTSRLVGPWVQPSHDTSPFLSNPWGQGNMTPIATLSSDLVHGSRTKTRSTLLFLDLSSPSSSSCPGRTDWTDSRNWISLTSGSTPCSFRRRRSSRRRSSRRKVRSKCVRYQRSEQTEGVSENRWVSQRWTGADPGEFGEFSWSVSVR